ncbi:unnamed protein product [Didymodactylos carnosus]|uniref:Uncharacterized protein n=3 Tax=Didymodactylos carnosus TaxID=1234261 RepID=A0A814CDM3_9BILA|nr:unnamed protein product [Didymodactylos carnosus]CAF3716137.1 unnamed protein product [Didymodactylos carnosus]
MFQAHQQRSISMENPMSLDLRVKLRRENGAIGIFEIDNKSAIFLLFAYESKTLTVDWTIQDVIQDSKFLAILVACYVKNRPPPACDMKIAENRDFDSFYGITGLKNHFTTPTADECNPNIIFRPALPQTILKTDNSASSFMTLAKYGTGTSKLEHFVNSFLGKRPDSLYLASQAQVQVQERNIFHEKLLLTHLKNDFERFSILKKDDERLHLLLAILEGEKFEHDAGRKYLYGNIFRDLTRFSVFVKNSLNKTPVFVIDGIDENRYFFQGNEVNKVFLELFCRSSVSQDILSMVMANNFYLSVFYPKIDGINIEDAIIRKDKFPTHTITWNTKSLINYADYVLQQMNKNAIKTRCKPFTDFKTLVNFSNKKIAQIIEKIPTPRALHYFMIALISEMNNDANSVKEPFKATFENVHAAYEESYQSYEKRHKLKE